MKHKKIKDAIKKAIKKNLKKGEKMAEDFRRQALHEEGTLLTHTGDSPSMARPSLELPRSPSEGKKRNKVADEVVRTAEKTGQFSVRSPTKSPTAPQGVKNIVERVMSGVKPRAFSSESMKIKPSTPQIETPEYQVREAAEAAAAAAKEPKQALKKELATPFMPTSDVVVRRKVDKPQNKQSKLREAKARLEAEMAAESTPTQERGGVRGTIKDQLTKLFPESGKQKVVTKKPATTTETPEVTTPKGTSKNLFGRIDPETVTQARKEGRFDLAEDVPHTFYSFEPGHVVESIGDKGEKVKHTIHLLNQHAYHKDSETYLNVGHPTALRAARDPMLVPKAGTPEHAKHLVRQKKLFDAYMERHKNVPLSALAEASDKFTVQAQEHATLGTKEGRARAAHLHHTVNMLADVGKKIGAKASIGNVGGTVDKHIKILHTNARVAADAANKIPVGAEEELSGYENSIPLLSGGKTPPPKRAQQKEPEEVYKETTAKIPVSLEKEQARSAAAKKELAGLPAQIKETETGLAETKKDRPGGIIEEGLTSQLKQLKTKHANLSTSVGKTPITDRLKSRQKQALNDVANVEQIAAKEKHEAKQRALDAADKAISLRLGIERKQDKDPKADTARMASTEGFKTRDRYLPKPAPFSQKEGPGHEARAFRIGPILKKPDVVIQAGSGETKRDVVVTPNQSTSQGNVQAPFYDVSRKPPSESKRAAEYPELAKLEENRGKKISRYSLATPSDTAEQEGVVNMRSGYERILDQYHSARHAHAPHRKEHESRQAAAAAEHAKKVAAIEVKRNRLLSEAKSLKESGDKKGYATKRAAARALSAGEMPKVEPTREYLETKQALEGVSKQYSKMREIPDIKRTKHVKTPGGKTVIVQENQRAIDVPKPSRPPVYTKQAMGALDKEKLTKEIKKKTAAERIEAQKRAFARQNIKIIGADVEKLSSEPAPGKRKTVPHDEERPVGSYAEGMSDEDIPDVEDQDPKEAKYKERAGKHSPYLSHEDYVILPDPTEYSGDDDEDDEDLWASNFKNAMKNRLTKAMTAGYGYAGAPGAMSGGSGLMTESLDRKTKYITGNHCESCGQVTPHYNGKCLKCNLGKSWTDEDIDELKVNYVKLSLKNHIRKAIQSGTYDGDSTNQIFIEKELPSIKKGTVKDFSVEVGQTKSGKPIKMISAYKRLQQPGGENLPQGEEVDTQRFNFDKQHSGFETHDHVDGANFHIDNAIKHHEVGKPASYRVRDMHMQHALEHIARGHENEGADESVKQALKEAHGKFNSNFDNWYVKPGDRK